MTALERITDKCVVDETTGCWKWTGSRNTGGYGHLSFGGRRQLAHRVAWTLFVGPIPDGLHIDHLCRNRGCVNPSHLEPVTPLENVMRGVGWGARNRRVTHCPRGHAYDETNTKITSIGGRACRACRQAQQRERRQARAQQEAV